MEVADGCLEFNVINITCKYPISNATFVLGLAMPAVTMATIIANSIAISIFLKKSMRTPINVMAAMIACFEILVLVPQLPWWVYFFTLDGDKSLTSTVKCKAWSYMCEDVADVVHMTIRVLMLIFAAGSLANLLRTSKNKLISERISPITGLFIFLSIAFCKLMVVWSLNIKVISRWTIDGQPETVCIKEMADWRKVDTFGEWTAVRRMEDLSHLSFTLIPVAGVSVLLIFIYRQLYLVNRESNMELGLKTGESSLLKHLYEENMFVFMVLLQFVGNELGIFVVDEIVRNLGITVDYNMIHLWGRISIYNCYPFKFVLYLLWCPGFKLELKEKYNKWSKKKVRLPIY